MGMDTQENAGHKARILCVWEMGGNLGHLTNLKLFAEQALKRGHHVILAVRELHHVPAVFAELDVEVWQAPHLKLPSVNGKKPMVSYTDMVVQQGFGSAPQLWLLVQAWQRLFDVVKPDLVIYDHAPSALISSVGKRWKKWIVGSGFLIPRTDGEFLGVFPDVRRSEENGQTLRQREQEALSMINEALKRQGQRTWESLKPWFEQCDRQLLTTLAAVDHFGKRPDGDYLGVVSSVDGAEPVWKKAKSASAKNTKVFVYVNNFAELPQLLESLLTRSRVLLYCKNLPSAVRDRFSGRLVICEGPVSMSRLVNSGCYFVTNGNHGTAVQAFLAGIPQLLVPLQREQYLFSVRIERAARGVIALPDDQNFDSAVERLFQLEKLEKKRSLEIDNARIHDRLNQCFEECGF